jgi:hypothetical protein
MNRKFTGCGVVLVVLASVTMLGCSGANPVDDEPTGQTSAASMTGCNGHVCIHIEGAGTYVEYVTATVKPTSGSYVCQAAAYLSWAAPGQHESFSNVDEGNGCYYEEVTFRWNFYRNFTNDTKMCATGFEDYSVNVGEPCGTIHS